MRFILLLSTVSAIGLATLTGCENKAATVKTETAKANVNVATPQKTNAPAAPTDDAPRIVLADAKKDFDAGNAVFIDTRAEATYKQEHIKGAINIPVEAVEAKYKEIPANKKVIAYCS